LAFHVLHSSRYILQRTIDTLASASGRSLICSIVEILPITGGSKGTASRPRDRSHICLNVGGMYGCAPGIETSGIHLGPPLCAAPAPHLTLIEQWALSYKSLHWFTLAMLASHREDAYQSISAFQELLDQIATGWDNGSKMLQSPQSSYESTIASLRRRYRNVFPSIY
jgi:hypothetical protein